MIQIKHLKSVVGDGWDDVFLTVPLVISTVIGLAIVAVLIALEIEPTMDHLYISVFLGYLGTGGIILYEAFQIHKKERKDEMMYNMQVKIGRKKLYGYNRYDHK